MMKIKQKREQTQNVRQEIKNKSGFSTVRTMKKTTCIIAIALVLVFSASFLVEAISSFVAENYTAENLGESTHVEPKRWEDDGTDWLNRQFAVGDGSGGFKNMTQLSEMGYTTSMYVLIASNFEGQDIYQNGVKTGSDTNCTYYKKNFIYFNGTIDGNGNVGYYDTNISPTVDFGAGHTHEHLDGYYGLFKCKPLKYNYGEDFKRFVWKITKHYDGCFSISPYLYPDYQMTLDTIFYNSNNVKQFEHGYGWAHYGSTGSWRFVKSDDGDNVYNIIYNNEKSTTGQDIYLSRYIGNGVYYPFYWNDGYKDIYFGDTPMGGTVSDSYPVTHGANEWMVMPLLQDQDPTVTYGYRKAASYVDFADREQPADVDSETGTKELISTIMALDKDQQALNSYGLLMSAYAYSANFESPYVMNFEGDENRGYYGYYDPSDESNRNSIISQLWNMTTRKEYGFLTMFWSTNRGNFLSIDDSSAWGNSRAHEDSYLCVDTNDKYDTYQDNNFWTIYSLNADGGYYIAPIAYDDVTIENTKSNTRYQFRVLDNYWATTYNSFYPMVNSYDGSSSQRFWIETKPVIEVTVTDQHYDSNKNYVGEIGKTTELFWFGSAFLPAYTDNFQEDEIYLEKGYHFTSYSSTYFDPEINDYPQVTPDHLFRQRRYTGNKYTINFNGNKNTGGADVGPIEAIYGENVTLPNNTFIREYLIEYKLNGGVLSPTTDTYKWEFSGWSKDQHAIDYEYENLGVVKNLMVPTTDGGQSTTLYAVWEDTGMTAPVPTRDKHSFYGWTKAENPGPNDVDNSFKTTISGITADTTLYALWAGADFTNIKDNLGTNNVLSVEVNVWTENDKITSVTDEYGYVWYKVTDSSNSNSTPITGNNDSNSYKFSSDDKGCAFKVIVLDGLDVEFDAAYSRLIPTDIPVDPEPIDSKREEKPLSGTLDSNNKIAVEFSGIISGAENNTGSDFKVYGICSDGGRVLVLDNGAPVLNKSNPANPISFEGIAFESYEVEFANADVTLSNFKLMVLPRVFAPTIDPMYTQTTDNVGCEAELLEAEANDDKFRGEDNEGKKYFYPDDALKLKIDLDAKNTAQDKSDYKLAAGSYVTINGKVAYPAYSNSENGIVYIESLSDTDTILYNTTVNNTKPYEDKITAEGGKIIVENSLKILTNLSRTTNTPIIHNINLGIAEVEANNNKLSFTTMWYLDDYATEHSWYRGNYAGDVALDTDDNGFGVYIIKVEDLITEGNDFYNYLVKKGKENLDANTTSGRVELLSCLEDFIGEWNVARQDGKIPDGMSEGDFTRKMNFGTGVAIDDVSENYYLGVEGDKRFVRHKTSINVPEKYFGKPIICIPYASYTHTWENSWFTPRREHPQKVFIYGNASSLSTYTGKSQTLAIDDVNVIKGESATLNITLNGAPYDASNLNIRADEGLTFVNGTVTANVASGTYNCVATTLDGHETTFKVNVLLPEMSIEDVEVVYVPDGTENVSVNEVTANVTFSNGVNYNVTYSYDTSIISINNGVITAKVGGKVVTVTATADVGGEDVTTTFKVTTYDLPNIKDVTVFVDNHVEQVGLTSIDQNLVQYPATDYYPKDNSGKVVSDIEFVAYNTNATAYSLRSTVTRANVQFAYDINKNVWFVDNQGVLLEGEYPAIATYKNVEISFTVEAVETNKSQPSLQTNAEGTDGSGNKVYAWDNTKYSNSAEAFGDRTANRVTQLNEWLDSTYVDGQNVRNQTTLFIGDSFFDVTDKDDSWYWFPFYTSDELYKDKNALSLNISGTTTYDWEQWITTDGAWVDNITDTPKNIVVNLGTNNIGNIFRSSTLSDSEVGDIVYKDLQRFMLVLHEKFPNTPIYWYGIAGRTNSIFITDETLEVDTPNSRAFCSTIPMIEWCNERPWITYVDPAVGENLVDGLHPNEVGHKNMAASLSDAMSTNGDSIADRQVAHSSEPTNVKFTATQNDANKEYSVFTYGAPLRRDYYIKGTMKINGINSNADLASLAFGLFGGADTSDMAMIDCFSLSKKQSDDKFRLSFNEAYDSTPDTHMYSAEQLNEINFMILVDGNDVYFLMGRTNESNSGEWALKLVYRGMLAGYPDTVASNEDKKRVDLRILSSYCDVEVTFIDIGFKDGNAWVEFGNAGDAYKANHHAVMRPTVANEQQGYGGWIYNTINGVSKFSNGRYFHNNDLNSPNTTIYFNDKDNAFTGVQIVGSTKGTYTNEYGTILDTYTPNYLNATALMDGKVDLTNAEIGSIIQICVENVNDASKTYKYVIKKVSATGVAIGWYFNNSTVANIDWKYTHNSLKFLFCVIVDNGTGTPFENSPGMYGATHFAISDDNETWHKRISSNMFWPSIMTTGGEEIKFVVSGYRLDNSYNLLDFKGDAAIEITSATQDNAWYWMVLNALQQAPMQ